jgi:hypothetical protein
LAASGWPLLAKTLWFFYRFGYLHAFTNRGYNDSNNRNKVFVKARFFLVIEVECILDRLNLLIIVIMLLTMFGPNSLKKECAAGCGFTS